MNIATYTRAIAAAFLNVHRAALLRVAAAADSAAEKAFADVDRTAAEAAAIKAVHRAALAAIEHKRGLAYTISARADAVAQAVVDELALLPYSDR